MILGRLAVLIAKVYLKAVVPISQFRTEGKYIDLGAQYSSGLLGEFSVRRFPLPNNIVAVAHMQRLAFMPTINIRFMRQIGHKITFNLKLLLIKA